MNEINEELMQLSLMVMEKLEEKIRAQGNEKIQNITKFPDTKESKSSDTFGPPRLREKVIGIDPSKITKPHVETRHESEKSRVMTKTIKGYRILKARHANDHKIPSPKPIMSKRSRRSTRGEASSSQAPTLADKIQELGVFESVTHQHFYNNFVALLIQSGSVVSWTFFSRHGFADEFFQSINRDAFSRPQCTRLLTGMKIDDNSRPEGGDAVWNSPDHVWIQLGRCLELLRRRLDQP
ncbi:hypothetical protein Tco_1118924 [Tanacetum coccineum]